eukprot:2855428-Pleurochrysis_carterae.AAC.3
MGHVRSLARETERFCACQSHSRHTAAATDTPLTGAKLGLSRGHTLRQRPRATLRMRSPSRWGHALEW